MLGHIPLPVVSPPRSQPPVLHLLHAQRWLFSGRSVSPVLGAQRPGCASVVLGDARPCAASGAGAFLIFAARARCWVVFISLAPGPAACAAARARLPCCRAWRLVSGTTFFPARLARSWAASQASAVSTAPPVLVPSANLRGFALPRRSGH